MSALPSKADVKHNVIDKDGKNPRARFHEQRMRLAAKKLIGCRDEWLATVKL